MTAQDTISTDTTHFTLVNSQRSLRIGELLLIALGLAALMAAEIAACKPRLIFDGPFVLDERLTDLIVRDPSISHSIDAVRHGVDTNPPVFHLIDRAFWMGTHSLFHDSPRVTLRAFSTLCTWLSLVGVFVLLRKGFSTSVALVGVLAVWAHPDVVEQSADARFYPPLLLASVATCLALQIRGPGIVRGIIVALCAILLCTLHYFGIIILAPLVFATLLIDDGPFSRRIIRVLPTIAGPLALLPFVSFIRTQHAGLTVKTWVDPFSFHLARDFAQQVLSPMPLLIVVSVWAISQLMRNTTVLSKSTDRQSFRAATVPMLSLLAVPLIIIAFSAVVQPALINRYAIAAALVLAPLAAMLGQNVSGRLLLLTALLLSGFTVLELHGVASKHASALRILTDRRDELGHEEPPLPIVFADRSDATELQTFAPDLLPRMFIVDLRQPGIVLRDFRTYETEMVEKVSPFYPFPPLITPRQMAALGKFHLVVPQEDAQNLLLELPMQKVGGSVYEAVK
jgi:hypothetical protein